MKRILAPHSKNIFNTKSPHDIKLFEILNTPELYIYQ
jgi:hypothetical protein